MPSEVDINVSALGDGESNERSLNKGDRKMPWIEIFVLLSIILLSVAVEMEER